MSEAAVSDWLTLAEAAEVARLSEKTLQRAIYDGSLDASGGGAPGVVILIRRDRLEAWLAQRGGGGTR